jgi:hypothetical protein
MLLGNPAVHVHSNFHVLIWVCGIIGTVGVAIGTCIGIVRWMGAVYHKAVEVVGNIGKIQALTVRSDETAQVVAATKMAVDLIQTNHLAHLESGITDVAKTNAQLVALSTDIRDGIIKLVDRTRDA